MPAYVVELYVPRSRAGGVEADAARARRATYELTREGSPIRYVRTIFVPDDEICFHLFEAASADAVREAADRASLTYERIIEALQ